MEFKSQYVAKKPNAKGYVAYEDKENAVWQALFSRQQQLLPGRACDAYLQGMAKMQLDPNTIPQIPDINQFMRAATGWTVAPVAALISPEAFFELLAKRQFPAAMGIITMLTLLS